MAEPRSNFGAKLEFDGIPMTSMTARFYASPCVSARMLMASITSDGLSLRNFSHYQAALQK